MKVASFNVNSIRARLPAVISWLQKNQPDALAMQETKVQDDEFPKAAFEEIGYSCVFRGQKGYNGVAVAARHPIAGVQFGLPDEPRDEARLLRSSIRNLIVVNTYVPQGDLPTSDRFQYKLAWFGRLLDYFRTSLRPTDPVLWMGDLNIAPLPIDVYDPVTLLGHVCYHPAVHQALEEIMRWGFTDVFRLHCRDAGKYTFWDYRLSNSFQRNRGWRLDHIMATQPLADRCTACYIDTEPRVGPRPSDHTPIMAEFNW
ncbi:MAG: exodeoxyribonuclease III [Planctomycetes bacterium RBG_13_62_9]|nr:MAG: exodeoxyribonuclease III [Planctomycetes bacterium RBG_13_62_9]